MRLLCRLNVWYSVCIEAKVVSLRVIRTAQSMLFSQEIVSKTQFHEKMAFTQPTYIQAIKGKSDFAKDFEPQTRYYAYLDNRGVAFFLSHKVTVESITNLTPCSGSLVDHGENVPVTSGRIHSR